MGCERQLAKWVERTFRKKSKHKSFGLGTKANNQLTHITDVTKVTALLIWSVDVKIPWIFPFGQYKQIITTLVGFVQVVKLITSCSKGMESIVGNFYHLFIGSHFTCIVSMYWASHVSAVIKEKQITKCTCQAVKGEGLSARHCFELRPAGHPPWSLVLPSHALGGALPHKLFTFAFQRISVALEGKEIWDFFSLWTLEPKRGVYDRSDGSGTVA